MARNDDMSPMMGQYLNLKENYKDCIVFYRLGDFYEMFFDDAIKASKLLELTLTGRDCGKGQRAPMCGVPYHAAETYIAKLIELGEKVAICEQIESVDDKGRKVVSGREVVKIVSAGTVTDTIMLDEKSNNYALSICEIAGKYSIAWTDISTGDFYVKFLGKIDDFMSLSLILSRIMPSEIICSQSVFANAMKCEFSKKTGITKFSPYKEWAFNSVHAERVIKEQFEVANLVGLGFNDELSTISAVGALIEYLRETQKHAIKNVNKIEFENDADYMILDGTALKNLEILRNMRDNKRFGSLLWVLDNTKTSMGSRMLSLWLSRPLLDIQKINQRLDGVEELYNNPLMRNGANEVLSNISDTERLTGKISNNLIMPRDCKQLGESLSAFPSLKLALAGCNSYILKKCLANIADFSELANLLNKAISDQAPITMKEGNYIAKGFDKELDRLREISTNGKELLDQLVQREREATGIKNLKYGYNKVFGYYLEVTNSYKSLVPYTYIRKQTLVGGERYITEELKQIEDDILNAKEKSLALESEIFNKIRGILLDNLKLLQLASKAVSIIDVILSFAIISKKNSYARPTLLPSDNNFNLIASRHPVVEEISYDAFIPNDCMLNSDSDRMMIITGPNMAGKSTYMRQIALNTIIAQIGCFVPCKKAEIPIVDRIFTRVGASDNLISDQSTFMVEMNEVALILNSATKNSLLILDEVGRGTSTYDGLSIAWAVVEYITNKIKAKTLFATHYHELSKLESVLDGVKNYKVTVREDGGKVVFLRKIEKGSANRSFGIEVASLAGVPKVVTDSAKKILLGLEKREISVISSTQTDDKQSKVLVSEVENTLKAIDLDSLSPREALDLLYSLKSQIKE